MKSCSRCKKRNTCTRICQEVEARIPGVYAGSDPRREVSMPPESLRVAVEVHSYCLWVRGERKSGYTADLSVLTKKEIQAIMLIAKGCSQRAAARRLGIHLKSLQSRIDSARAKLHPRQTPHVARGERGHKRKGGE